MAAVRKVAQDWMSEWQKFQNQSSQQQNVGRPRLANDPSSRLGQLLEWQVARLGLCSRCLTTRKTARRWKNWSNGRSDELDAGVFA